MSLLKLHVCFKLSGIEKLKQKTLNYVFFFLKEKLFLLVIFPLHGLRTPSNYSPSFTSVSMFITTYRISSSVELGEPRWHIFPFFLDLISLEGLSLTLFSHCRNCKFCGKMKLITSHISKLEMCLLKMHSLCDYFVFTRDQRDWLIRRLLIGGDDWTHPHRVTSYQVQHLACVNSR